jgi:hypothetical protein
MKQLISTLLFFTGLLLCGDGNRYPASVWPRMNTD